MSASAGPPGVERALRGAATLLAVALALRVSVGMWAIAVPSPRLQQFDMAARGVAGVKMADAVRSGDPGRFWELIDRSTVWPPLAPLVEAPAFLAFGNDYDVAEGQMIVWFFLLVLAAYAAGVALGGARGVLVGAVSAAFVATSPYAQVFASQIMLEVPGSALLLLSMAFYVRWRRLGTRRDLSLACVATVLLFFAKYNYALMWMIPLALNELGHSLPSPAAFLEEVRRGARDGRWRRPYWIVVAAWALVLAVLAFRGGSWGFGAGDAGGRGLRLPFIGLLALIVLRLLHRPRHNLRALGAWLRGLPDGARAFVVIVLPPIGLWLASPAHLKGFVHFAVNRSGAEGTGGLRGLLLYPEWFVTEYSAGAAWGGLALAGALAGLFLLRSRSAAVRIAPLAMLVGFLMCEAHGFKSSRFLFTVTPLIWFSCALVTATALEWPLRRARPGVASRAGLSAACAVLAAALALGFDPAVARGRFETWSTPGSVRRVLDVIADVDVSSRGTLLLGTWNRLSPGLVEWHQRLRHPEARRAPRPKNPQWYRAGDGRALARAIGRDTTLERVMVLGLPQGAPAYGESFERENPWLADARTALEGDPRFLAERTLRFDDSGYELRILRRVR